MEWAILFVNLIILWLVQKNARVITDNQKVILREIEALERKIRSSRP